MQSPLSTRHHLRRLTTLALPVVGAQLGAMLMWFVDLAMLGRVGLAAIDAASLGRVWVVGTVVLGMGLVFGMDPVATHAFGAGDERRLAAVLRHGAWLALGSSLPLAALWLLCRRILEAAGQQPELAAAAHRYVLVQIPGLPFFLLFMVAKQYLQARGEVLPALWVTLVANLFNAGANWVLIYGRWGAPALGVVGAGIATSLTEVLLAAGLGGWVVWREWRCAVAPLEHQPVGRSAGIGEIARHGAPVAVHLALEMWGFQLATLLAGWLGKAALAAHTIALTLASVAFMVPLGLSLAAVTRVGNLIGAGQPHEARRASAVALALGAGVMAVAGTLFWAGRFRLPTWFTSDPEVVALTARVLPVAAAFQIFDGTQVVATGVLRGMGRTLPPAVFNLVGYYLLALPLGWWLGVRVGLGVVGIWWGLALGLGSVAALLVYWIVRSGRRTV